jgi:acetylglutamate/LysW-gamma-L-alpha-aminoadipate kinase
MVMVGKINKSLVVKMLRAGISAIGLSGLDGGVVKARRKERLVIIDERGKKRIIEGGYTGRIIGVNVDLLKLLINEGYLPVISPVAIGERFECLNVNSDRVAAFIAGSLKSDAVVFFTDVEGIVLDGKLVRKMRRSEVEEVLPKVGSGMKVKLYACAEALDMGAKKAVIASVLGKKPLTSALNGSVGTVIVHV